MRGSLRAYARHRAEVGLEGQSLPSVQKAIAAKRISKGADGLIDFAAADRDWARNTAQRPSVRPSQKPAEPAAQLPDATPEPVAANPGADGNAAGYAAARALREGYLAGLAKLQYEERLGKLIEADEVRLAIGQVITMARERLLAIGSELRDRMAATKDANECQRLIDERVRRALSDLANFDFSKS